MRNLVSITALLIGLLSGCATTEKLTQKINLSAASTPLSQVLKERPDLRKNLSTVEIRQYFNRVENPTAAEVKITETGLLDDSVKSIRTIYRFKNVNDDWKMLGSAEEYQCARGKNKAFQSAKCS